LGIGGVKDAPALPWFVVAKNHNKNELIAIQGGDNPLLLSQTLNAIDLNWISGQQPEFPIRCKAKTRYRQPDQDCQISLNNKGMIQVDFDKKQRAVTPGQSVVFYDDNVCLGGGIIHHTDTLTETCEFYSVN
jgi:tRNA-specific 2-thiouridylase